MRFDWIMVSLRVMFVLCAAFLCWAEGPHLIKSAIVKPFDSYIDDRVEEHLALSIHVNGPPPPVKELDGYDLNRQSAR